MRKCVDKVIEQQSACLFLVTSSLERRVTSYWVAWGWAQHSRWKGSRQTNSSQSPPQDPRPKKHWNNVTDMQLRKITVMLCREKIFSTSIFCRLYWYDVLMHFSAASHQNSYYFVKQKSVTSAHALRAMPCSHQWHLMLNAEHKCFQLHLHKKPFQSSMASYLHLWKN